MINLKSIIFLLATAASLLSCEKQTKTFQNTDNTLSLQFNEILVKNTPLEFTLEVQSNCDWKVKNNSEWVTVSPKNNSYSGTKTLTISISENTEKEQRSAQLFFAYATTEDTLKITQEAFDAYLDVSVNQISFGYRSAEKTISITSNCGWLAKSEVPWITIRPSTGLVGNFEMEINAETNNSPDKRYAKVYVWNEQYGLEQNIIISQEGQPQISGKDYVDEYGVNRGNGILIGERVWAPVNCGYENEKYPYGKLFQWGRRFGLGYNDGIFKDADIPAISEIWIGENGAEDMHTFYKFSDKSSFNYDWILNGDDSFWNLGSEENPHKNDRFDPCPDGWRIPTAFEFKSLIEFADREWIEKDGQNGYLFTDRTGNRQDAKSSLFLPDGGRLNTVDGKAFDRNTEAYYWTITVSSGSSAYFYFYNKDCNINYHGSRAGGCSIRCIRE